MEPSMPSGSSGSAQEIQWLIEERKRRIEDLEEQMSASTDEDFIRGLKGMMSMLRSEIAELEHELDEKEGEAEDPEDIIRDLDAKIRDIDSQMQLETDPVVRNNLEVSKRFLQMERNAQLIKMTQTVERKDPLEERVEELERLCDSRQRYIQDLEERLRKAEKDVSYYKAIADNPDRLVNCDATRVSVTAGKLAEMRNEAKMLAINNGNLKSENRELKSQILLLNVMELTKHCRESDSQVLILQKRVVDLRKQLEDGE
ncbi:MAG: hypothetical protein MJZ38_02115 [archaeon]|nr:hypothetical protein [archaeon]